MPRTPRQLRSIQLARLLDFPDELLVEVCRHVPMKIRQCLRESCRRFRSVVDVENVNDPGFGAFSSLVASGSQTNEWARGLSPYIPSIPPPAPTFRTEIKYAYVGGPFRFFGAPVMRVFRAVCRLGDGDVLTRFLTVVLRAWKEKPAVGAMSRADALAYGLLSGGADFGYMVCKWWREVSVSLRDALLADEDGPGLLANALIRTYYTSAHSVMRTISKCKPSLVLQVLTELVNRNGNISLRMLDVPGDVVQTVLAQAIVDGRTATAVRLVRDVKDLEVTSEYVIRNIQDGLRARGNDIDAKMSYRLCFVAPFLRLNKVRRVLPAFSRYCWNY